MTNNLTDGYKMCNEMGYKKCRGCEFFIDISDHTHGIMFACKITGAQLILKDCIECE